MSHQDENELTEKHVKSTQIYKLFHNFPPLAFLMRAKKKRRRESRKRGEKSSPRIPFINVKVKLKANFHFKKRSYMPCFYFLLWFSFGRCWRALHFFGHTSIIVYQSHASHVCDDEQFIVCMSDVKTFRQHASVHVRVHVSPHSLMTSVLCMSKAKTFR